MHTLDTPFHHLEEANNGNELFPSAKEALDAGIRAIDEKGIESFIGDSKA